MALRFRLAQASDGDLFDKVAEGVFDRTIDPNLLAEFLADPRHHIAVADENGVMVGLSMAWANG